MKLTSDGYKILTYVGLISCVTVISSVYAGGFQLWEQDASSLGDYHAGAAAEADSAGTEFYNPAGIVRLKKPQVSLGAALVALDLTYSGGVTPSLGTVSNVPGGTTNIVPNFHVALPLSHRWFFAFGTTTPFGLETNYPVPVVAPLFPTRTKLETINLNPSLAYVINRYLSVGAGFDLIWGSADYDEDVFGSFIQSKTSLSGWDCGYNAGLLVQFTPATRLGLSYRSAINVHASGNSIATNSGVAKTSTSTATFPLPATSILSVYHDINSRITLMASAFYTDWSTFRQLILHNVETGTSPTSKDQIINENYRNTWNLAVGGKYRYNDHLIFEAGFGHDQTPTQIGYRDIRLPDNNRYALSLGVNVIPTPGFIWSIGWTHFFVPTTQIDNSLSGGAPPTTIGTATGEINVIGVQFSCDV